MPEAPRRIVWRRVKAPRSPTGVVPLDHLSKVEEENVRRAVRALHRRYGTWEALCRAMQMHRKSLERNISGRDRIVPAALAIRVARVAGVSVEDVLEGRFPAADGVCPQCGHRLGL